MATFSQSTVDKGSDSVIDFCCSPCLEHKIDQWAEFYCDNCLKCYCAKCITLHGQLFGKHLTYGRRDTNKWPVSKEVEDFLKKCDLHEDKRLEMYCDDHSQLCCTYCAFLNHRLCAKVTLISESDKGPPPDLLSRQINTILEEFNKLQNILDSNMQLFLESYNKQLHEIHQTRQKMNTILDEIEKNTLKELDDKMTCIKASLQIDVDNCSRFTNELERLSDAYNDIVHKGKSQLTFIASQKCLEKIKQTETYLKENSVQVESSLTFQANRDVHKYFSKLSGLGRIGLITKASSVLGDKYQVFTVQGKSEYDTSIPSDSQKSIGIRAISVLADDQILVADSDSRVKLLNHQYQVVGHCKLTSLLSDMCRISPSEVAVAVNKNKTHGVQFVSVNSGQLVQGRKLQFQHDCYGIAHNLQDLYVTSGTALYKYSMDGALAHKLYEDTSSMDACNIMAEISGYHLKL